MKIRIFTAIALFISVISSGIALAASGSNIAIENGQSALYISNLDNQTTEQTSAPQIIQDLFIAAANTPDTKTTATKTVREMYVTSTGYNSEVGQTDDSPFITANGEHVYWGGVAANFLPFGTKIKIPDYYGDKVFIVNDRMNRRFNDRVDVWFPERQDALQWGRRTIRIEIVES